MAQGTFVQALRKEAALSGTFMKGRSLMLNGAVLSIEDSGSRFSKNVTVEGSVRGSRGDLYKTHVALDMDEHEVIDYDCDCPAAYRYPGMCKHAIATALAVTGFLSIPLHAYSISAVTGVLRAGGDVFWSTLLDVGPQWCMALPLTALLALVLKADYWWIAAAIQSESLLKVPLCALRIRTGQWIHDVTVRKERGQ